MAETTLLRFITCGSVDDGKSTLIGRLLHETRQIFEDQADALARDSRKHGTTGDDVDYALLVDGLEAEREQGITIDVAYRFFATPARKFIVADTPGHEQYTRNMATGASTADLAIVLVDARKGVLTQTRRHSFIASLLGIRHVILAVNKIDLMGFDQAVFDDIVSDYAEVAGHLGLERVEAIPLSARYGDNIAERSARLSWYGGPTLIELLERAPTANRAGAAPFRLPIQYVSRPNLDFRGFAGTVASGEIAAGDPVTVAKSGVSTKVSRIVGPDGDQERATAGQAVTLVLADEVEASRGNMLCRPTERPEVADQFAAHIVWMDEQPMLPGRSYWLRTETDQVPATVTDLKHRQDVNTFAHEAAKSLELNEIGLCNLSTQAPVAFDPYADNRVTGAFVLIDRMTNATAGAGMILHPLRRAANVHWQAITVDAEARAALKHQKPAVLWFTGLSGSGKSTIANLLEKKLHAQGRHTFILDGDNVRHGLNRDLGFTEVDRVENIRRVAEVARLMAEAGLLVIVSFISPFRAERRMARELMPEGQFVEIFVDTPFDVCAERDPKGLYAKALRGEIANFTGLDSPYEPPENAELRLDTQEDSADALAERLEAWLSARGYC
ncbi:sulfate adenylyltransferase subunit CysN [Brevundimonas lutea]|uniref:sulfate adenylyltransferase subunit CysN n=1 Tax=Brevundimonas lutea TaxID=2293980 RepID=UPI000F0336F9|nr:sulfate adenylyltransferase subunit CysN [Brevundimonas lutea]